MRCAIVIRVMFIVHATVATIVKYDRNTFIWVLSTEKSGFNEIFCYKFFNSLLAVWENKLEIKLNKLASILSMSKAGAYPTALASVSLRPYFPGDKRSSLFCPAVQITSNIKSKPALTLDERCLSEDN